MCSVWLTVVGACVTSFAGAYFLFKPFIHFFRHHLPSGLREGTPERHRVKSATPTMGGLVVLAAVILTLVLWLPVTGCAVASFLLLLISYAAIGFLDDWRKIARKSGISARLKFCLQWLCAFAAVALWMAFAHPSTLCTVSLFGWSFDWGIFFPVWASFVIVGTSNAVNLTDGLDGLAISSLIPAYLTVGFLGAFVYGQTHVIIVAVALSGAGIAFYWYNRHPARIIMGDVGALPLGAALALLALMIRQELLLPIVGVVFVIETVSVIAQVISFKARGKRLFLMAPIHHHFELLHWSEKKIVHTFTAVTIAACVVVLWFIVSCCSD